MGNAARLMLVVLLAAPARGAVAPPPGRQRMPAPQTPPPPVAVAPGTPGDGPTDPVLPAVAQFGWSLCNVDESAAMAHAHAEWAAGQKALFPSESAVADYAAAAWLRARAWAMLAYAADPTSLGDRYVYFGPLGGWQTVTRVEAVDCLADLLGADDFAAGRMPPPVPWRAGCDEIPRN